MNKPPSFNVTSDPCVHIVYSRKFTGQSYISNSEGNYLIDPEDYYPVRGLRKRDEVIYSWDYHCKEKTMRYTSVSFMSNYDDESLVVSLLWSDE